jgi:hypothetical protein
VLEATYVTTPPTLQARDSLIAACFADVALLLGQPREAAAA